MHEIGIRPGEKLHEEMISAGGGPPDHPPGRPLRAAAGPRVVGLHAARATAIPVQDGFAYTLGHQRPVAHRRRRSARSSSTTYERDAPYGRQSVDDDDVAAVVEVLRGDWLTTGPTVAAFERRPRRPRPARLGASASRQRHGGPPRRLRGGRRRPGRRGRDDPADLRGDRVVRPRCSARRSCSPTSRRTPATSTREAVEAAVTERTRVVAGSRLRRPPGRHRRAARGRRRRGRTPARGRRALDRLALPRPPGRVARRPDDVLVLPDEEHDDGRGRRGRHARPRPGRRGPRGSTTSAWSATRPAAPPGRGRRGTRRCTSSG